MAIGIGEEVSEDELNQIATPPTGGNVILYDDFTRLGESEEIGRGLDLVNIL